MKGNEAGLRECQQAGLSDKLFTYGHKSMNAVPWDEPGEEMKNGDPVPTPAGLPETAKIEEASTTFDDYYQMSFLASKNLLTVSFGKKQTSKDHLVQIAKQQIDALIPEIVAAQQSVETPIALKITGAMTNMISAVVVAALFNKIRAIAIYDPDQAAYITVCNKDGTNPVGTAWRATEQV